MNNGQKKYIEVYNAIKMDILGGAYPAGGFLPTEQELMERYGVSRTTVRNAVALLKKDGFVDTTQGRGTQVLSVARNEGNYPFSTIPDGVPKVYSVIKGSSNKADVVTQGATIDVVEATSVVAAALGMEVGDKVYRLQRIKLADMVPFSYIVSYLSSTRFPGLENHSGQILFLYEFLQERYRVTVSSTTTRICAANADFIESRLLNIQSGTAIMTLSRTAFDADGPVEYSESYCRPDYVSTYVEISSDKHAEVPFKEAF